MADLARDDAIGRVQAATESGWSYVAWSGEAVHALEGDPFGGSATTGPELRLDDVRLLAPVAPGKIVAAAVNYVSHAIRRDPPEKPELFYKPISSVIGPGRQVVLPDDADIVEAEGELVLVIGRRAKHLTPETAAQAIFGYTCGFDISARNFQRADRHFWRAKGSDTFSPIGPRIARGVPGPDVALTTRINGEVKQQTTVGEMIFSPLELLVFASRYITFEPGDLFYTGTPGVPPGIVSGDDLRVDIDGVGALTMTVA
ncbi:fumarylacetoacetate hydrolase family protein [Compostimonas suwonensis]|uniref:2-keto-4-pentenoate hydratase/2-oxohepta-3-ene-1,7-dioic acid hydratase in catechol pathway n=1 Tax=Compostimonas suwonensis TaxID=1048394 RepID=A0A2M9C079_9MICO|nr:fumarylacetoacetate hydrolase family protein [Compostimonas suwonensis]PJJ63739.1 2-keto-4-pentenoate hydratase/2-oxohepta-3-ene-1,7-dioic acid hydratase in catechol pathway [Compostimonas suwonensis]